MAEIDAVIDQLTSLLGELFDEARRTLDELETLQRVRHEQVDPRSRQRELFSKGLTLHRRAERVHLGAADLHRKGGRDDRASVELERAAHHRQLYQRLRAEHPDWAEPDRE